MKLTIISSSIREGRQSDHVAYAIQSGASQMGIDQVSVIDLAKLEIPHMENAFGQIKNPGKNLSRINNELNEADILVFVSPEYNGTYTAQLKNAVDYFPKSHFENKPIGICSVSAGPLGGMRGAMQMQQLVLALWAFPIPNMLLVSNVSQLFDENRQLINDELKRSIDEFLRKLFWLGEAVTSKRSVELD